MQDTTLKVPQDVFNDTEAQAALQIFVGGYTGYTQMGGRVWLKKIGLPDDVVEHYEEQLAHLGKILHDWFQHDDIKPAYWEGIVVWWKVWEFQHLHYLRVQHCKKQLAEAIELAESKAWELYNEGVKIPDVMETCQNSAEGLGQVPEGGL